MIVLTTTQWTGETISLIRQCFTFDQDTIIQRNSRFKVEFKLAEHVSIGYYELGSAVKSKVTRFIELTSDSRPEDPSVKLHSGLYYHCNDVFTPEVGDLRIQFSFSGLEGTVVISMKM